MKEGGVDFVIGETYSYLGEALLAVECIKKAGLPAMVTMSFEQDPKSYEGDSVGRVREAAGGRRLRHRRHQLPAQPRVHAAAHGARSAPRSRASSAASPRRIAPRAAAVDFTALPEFPVGLDPLQLTRAEMADYAVKAKAMGIEFIGSCCGSVACHVKAMAKALGKLPPGERSWRVDYGKPMSAYEQHGHKD